LSITDTLHRFLVDEIVIATDSDRSSNWLARNVVDRARRLFPSQSTTSSSNELPQI
jgi:hypothetical protein